MSPLSHITPLVLTYNEAPNLERTLGRLTWAREILIVDSFSTDNTTEIARRFAQTRVIQRKFDSFASQCNFGLAQIHTPWVLSLDADYVLSEPLRNEFGQLQFDEDVAGYEASFRYWILGRPLRASLYPPRTVLYRREKARYFTNGHSHRVQVDGPVRLLSGWIEHDDRKPLERWLHEQNRYGIAEARYLREAPKAMLNLQDRLRRKIFIAPFLVCFYTLFAKGLILDGWPGWYYVLQRTLSEALLSLRLIENRLSTSGSKIEDRP